jgi:hypothetical protein
VAIPMTSDKKTNPPAHAGGYKTHQSWENRV